MRLKRTHILLLVLSVVAAAIVVLVLAYHFREGVKVTTTGPKKIEMKHDAKYQNKKYYYNGKIVKKIEFDFKDTLKGSPYFNDDGKVIIKGVLIPGPDEFKLKKNDSKDNKLYATKSGIDFIMKNVPDENISFARSELNANVAST